MINELSGIKYGNIGFWLPIILVPLTTLPFCILAGWWKIPEAGIVSGVLAASSYEMLMRTRLGCYDTDLLIIFFPICFAVGLIIWLDTIVRKSKSIDLHNAMFAICLQAIILGLLLKIYVHFHSSSRIIVFCMMGLISIPALLSVTKTYLYAVICGFLIILMIGDSPWYGLTGAIFITGVSWIIPLSFKNKTIRYCILGILILIFFISFKPHEKIEPIFSPMKRYFKAETPPPVKESQITLPRTINSIQEAVKVNIFQTIKLISGNWIIFIMGIGGLIFCFLKRPFSIVFLSLLFAGFVSLKLGHRFCIFGGAAIAFGIGFGSSIFFKDLVHFYITRYLLQLLLCFFVIYPSIRSLDLQSIQRFMTKPFANLLIETGQEAKPDANLWIWWDFGYAAQYFSEKRTLSDGMANGGDSLFLLGRLFTTQSPLFAHNLIVASAQEQLRQGPQKDNAAKILQYDCPLKRMIKDKTPEESIHFFNALEKQPIFSSHDKMLPEQYVIVSWDLIMSIHWIYNCGTWDLIKGEGLSLKDKIYMYRLPIEMNFNIGALKVRSKVIKLKTVDICTLKNIKHFTWKNPSKWHAIVNEPLLMLILMDESIYKSLMIRMLIGDPQQLEPYFELIKDASPLARSYRLK